MLVRCLCSSFAARRFFLSSSVVDLPISSPIATEEAEPNSNKPASNVNDSLRGRLTRIRKYDSGSAAAVFAKWKEEGRILFKHEIVSTVRNLIIMNGYAKALMICDSMLELKEFNLNPVDYALHMDLISRVRGLQSVELFFDDMPEEMKGDITMTALLRIFVKKGETVKAEALMEKMKKGGLLSKPEPYIHMLSLYISKEQFDKAEEMNNEVKKCIYPYVLIYNMWLKACASGKDVECTEKAFEHMKRAKVKANWLTHATLAGMYMKMKLFEKAAAALKDMEGLASPVDTHWVEVYSSLIRMHGNMGNKDEVMRIWYKLKSEGKERNCVYGAMVWTLLKLNLFEIADKIFEEWESFPKSSNAHSSPVFRTMLQRKYGGDQKLPPSSIPGHTQKAKVESERSQQP